MKRRIGLLLISQMLLSTAIFAQCYVTITNDTLWVCEGDAITLEALGGCQSIIVDEDFDNNSTGSGLYPEPGMWIDYSNPCSVYFPASGAVATICSGPARAIYTLPFNPNICDTITVQWDMKYGSNDGNGCCEAPDSANEGVHLQVLTVNSFGYQSWQDIEFYPSNLTQSGPHYSWNTYLVKIPNLFAIPNVPPMTQLRWAQLNFTGNLWDHWMIDNVKVSQQCDTSLGISWYTNGVFADSTQTLTLQPQTNTEVVVELTNGFISVYDTVTLVVYPSIQNVLGGDTVICRYNSIAFNIDTISGTYLWSNGSTQAIAIYDSNILNNDSVIWVERSFPNGCVSRDSIIVLLDPCSGIAENTPSRIHIFPNPANERITIRWERHSIEELSLYSIMGQEVVRVEIPSCNESHSLDVASLPAGIYFLRVSNGEERGFRQLVIH